MPFKPPHLRRIEADCKASLPLQVHLARTEITVRWHLAGVRVFSTRFAHRSSTDGTHFSCRFLKVGKQVNFSTIGASPHEDKRNAFIPITKEKQHVEREKDCP